MSLTRLALKFAAPLPKIENHERFLLIGPHPDDIEIGAGATAAKLAASGKAVCFLVCIDGRFGTANVSDGTTPEMLAKIRCDESKCSGAMLGVNDVRFLGLKDGGFYASEELLRGILRVIGEFKPDVVFAPDPCVTSECHVDHLNVGEAVRRAAYLAPYADIAAGYGAECANVKALAYYMTAKPNQFVKTSGLIKKQLDAIFSCHKSQFPDGCADIQSIGLYIKLRAADFGLRALCGQAEGFRVLGVTQMHCLPEAGE